MPPNLRLIDLEKKENVIAVKFRDTFERWDLWSVPENKLICSRIPVKDMDFDSEYLCEFTNCLRHLGIIENGMWITLGEETDEIAIISGETDQVVFRLKMNLYR